MAEWTGTRRRLHSPAIGAPAGDRARPLGPAVPGLPVRAGPAPGTSRTTAWSTRSRPLIDAGRVKLYCVDSLRRRLLVATGRLPLEDRARRHAEYEQWIIDQVRAVHLGRLRRPAEIGTIGASMGAFHALTFALAPGRPVPARRSACPATTTRRTGTAGASGATRPTSPTPPTSCPTCTATTWTGCGPGCRSLLVVGQGHVGGHHRRARRPPGGWPGCWRRRASARAGPVGARRPARLAVLAAPAGPPPAPVLLSGGGPMPEATAPSTSSACCSAPRRTGRARSRRWSTGSARSAIPTAPRTRCDTERITIEPFDLRAPAALRPGHRPAGVLVLPPAGVAEEGRADERHLPAQQPVHVPVDGEARRLLRDDPARASTSRTPCWCRTRTRSTTRSWAYTASKLQPGLRPGRGRRAGWATRCS